MDLNGILIMLTEDQVERVMSDVATRAVSPESLSVALSTERLTASPSQDDQRVSRSLLSGLIVLDCLPADGGGRGLADIAKEAGLSHSRTGRYLFTLKAIGLLVQDPDTQKYCRVFTAGPS
jgi:hypothetical protein